MNKYEALFDEILKRTESHSLQWRRIPRHANSDLIFDAVTVFRQSSADFERTGSKFKLLLVEKKVDDPEYDFIYQRYLPELLVLDDAGELVTTLSFPVIARSDLVRLAEMLEEQSEKSAKLFAAGAPSLG